MATGVLKDEASKELDRLLEKVEGKVEFTGALNEFLNRVRANLEKYGFNASMRMAQSLKALPTRKEPNKIVASIELEDYWEDLEKGTPAKGFTKEKRNKLQPRILEWINNKEQLQSIANTAQEKRALSYAIATNILKKGTIKRFGYKGKPFLTKEIPQLEKDIIKEFQP